MQSSDIPSWTAKKFAQSASGTYVRTVPQTTVDPAAASFDLGFPPQTFTDEGAGGTPPDGRDFNGILKYLSAWAQWVGLGGPVPYNPTVSSNGGYPKGAIVQSVTTADLLWKSTTENNTTNPDTGGAGWIALVPVRATTAQVRALADDIHAITPAKLKDFFINNPGLPMNLSLPGRYTLPGGLVIQWGAADAGASGSTVFPLFDPFGSACLFACVNGGNASPATSNGPFVSAYGTSSLTVYNSLPNVVGCRWLAIGF